MRLSKSTIAISYARFSSKGQAEGRSLKRQQELAQEYATKNHLVLDKSLSAQDLGRSAYDKSNIVKGELGRLLAAIDDGKVPRGATLIVESFDRLSRATPLDALEVLTSIVNAGLNLVTLTNPPMEFSRAILEEQPMLLHVAILVMQRAHEESKRKSGNVKDGWAKLKAGAKDGKVMTLKTPLWVTVVGTAAKRNDRAFQLIPDRAAIVKQIVEEAIKGVGNSSLTRWLNAQKVGAWTEQGWTHSVMQRMLSNHALYGAIELDGKLVEDYYPAVIDKTTFLFLQERRSQRATKKSTNRGGQNVTNLFSGRLRCGYCGAGMGVCGSVKLKDTGQVRKYIACFGARKDRDRCSMVYWPLDELEAKALIWMLNLKVYTIDDFDEDEDPYAIDANLMKLLQKQEFMDSAKRDEPR